VILSKGPTVTLSCSVISGIKLVRWKSFVNEFGSIYVAPVDYPLG
jgi:hypothetical protein